MYDFDWDSVEVDTVADKWKPAELGASIDGIITNLRAEHTKFSVEEVPVLTILTDEGVREVWAQQRHLKGELRARRPRVGDHIRISYVSDRDTGKASPMKVFEVNVSRS